MGIVTLVSGGVDSTLMSVLAQEEGIRVFPLFVNYGQLNVEMEWTACREVHRALNLPEVSSVDVHEFGNLVKSGLTCRTLRIYEDAFLPGRNLLLLLAGAAHAIEVGANGVAIGLLHPRGRLFDDQTDTFAAKSEELLCMAVGRPIAVLTPLIECSKQEVMTMARDRGIEGTYSCHAGDPEPCHRCISCKEIAAAKNTGGN